MALDQELGGALPGDGDPTLAASRLGLWLSESLREERLSLSLQLEARHAALAEELRSQLLHAQRHSGIFGYAAPSVKQPLENQAPWFLSADAAPQPPASQQSISQRSASPPPSLLGNRADGDTILASDKQKSFSESVAESCMGGSLGALLEKPSKTTGADQQREPAERKLSEGPLRFNLDWMVESPMFDRIFSSLIIMSTVVNAFEVQYEGVFTGLLIGAPDLSSADEHFCKDCKSIFVAFDWMFGLAFWLEMIAKVICMRQKFYRSVWNIVDVAINFMWLVHHLGNSLQFNPTVFRLLRMIRLVRLLRLGKVVSVMQMFDSLHLLMSSIRAGWSVLLWSTVLLVGVMLIAALSFNKLLVGFISNEDEDIAARLRVYRYYGDFTKAMLTMFEITLGNWVPVCRTISEDVNEWYGFIFISYELVVGFAMVKVITGVFMHETFNAVSSDDDLLILMRERQVAQYVRRMQSFFAAEDDDHDGRFSWEEFSAMISEERSKVWLSGMGLDVHDAQLTFELLDDGDGTLTTEELVRGFSRLRGEARSIDVISLLRNTRRVEKLVGEVGDHVRDIQLSTLRSAAAQRCGQARSEASSLALVPSSLPHPQSILAQAPRHRGDLFVGSCSEGVSDERLPCVLAQRRHAATFSWAVAPRG